MRISQFPVTYILKRGKNDSMWIATMRFEFGEIIAFVTVRTDIDSLKAKLPRQGEHFEFSYDTFVDLADVVDLEVRQTLIGNPTPISPNVYIALVLFLGIGIVEFIEFESIVDGCTQGAELELSGKLAICQEDFMPLFAHNN